MDSYYGVWEEAVAVDEVKKGEEHPRYDWESEAVSDAGA